MLQDWHQFAYHASIPWPYQDQGQADWIYGIQQVETWLINHIGHHHQNWAWSDSYGSYQIGVSFKWDNHRLLFLLKWA